MPAIPVGPVALAEAAPVVARPMLAWAFDVRHGDYRSTVIAATRKEAHALMIAEHFDEVDENCPRNDPDSEDECTIEECGCVDSGMSTVEREPNLDEAAARGDITIEDFHEAGWGYVCDRCGGEPRGWDWHPVGGAPVCDDCITIEEWRVINPKHAAELEEDARLDAMTDAEFEAYEAAKLGK